MLESFEPEGLKPEWNWKFKARIQVETEMRIHTSHCEFTRSTALELENFRAQSAAHPDAKKRIRKRFPRKRLLPETLESDSSKLELKT